MPPPPGSKKKKKGHAPAHQNKFAFRHNPKSKTTQKILESPNIHVCRRCYEKIEWRKKYRKYKPRTQPGKCNGCQRRNVLAAYHTICESCTINSTKAKEILKVHYMQQRQQESNSNQEEQEQEKLVQEECIHLRVCAMCVKEIALPDPEGEEDDHDDLAGLKLRERRAIERQRLRESQQGTGDNSNENENDSDDGDGNESVGDMDDDDDDDDKDDNDPFLAAIGGADKLLVGEAYQQKLMQQQRESS